MIIFAKYIFKFCLKNSKKAQKNADELKALEEKFKIKNST